MTSRVHGIAATALAFDRLADEYDTRFTYSNVGRSQREVIWERALATFPVGSHLLELNCGTGEDAVFLASAGMTVTACDVSTAMIAEARTKMKAEKPDARIEFVVLATEDIAKLPPTRLFNGAFSNFSGLNCVSDLRSVARELARRLEPGAPMLLCLSTRYCLWEIGYYLLRGNIRKAFRRCRGATRARIDEFEFPVYYPSIARLRSIFAPEFRLVSTTGVGIAVPPSYLESWIARHPQLFRVLENFDSAVRTWPGISAVGDHMLLHMERT
jgi:ubiquinone/menaquinone biosynthesis C-methylase UbiE